MPGPIFQQPPEVPHSNGNGAYPWWVRAGVYVVQTIGITAVISLGLLWWMLTTLDARLHTMSVEQTAMFRLLQQICVNGAETQEARATCWNPWR